MKSAVVVAHDSFTYPMKRVGAQFLAEGLARSGYEVHYICDPCSLLELRRSPERFRQVWLHRQDIRPFKVAKNLHEYTFRVPVPLDRRFIRFGLQLDMLENLLPRFFREHTFDLFVQHVCAGFVLANRIEARHSILRLQDSLEILVSGSHPILLQRFAETIRSGRYDEAWPVSDYLADYAGKIHPGIAVETIPNGIDLKGFSHGKHNGDRSGRAVFVGTVPQMIDFKLMSEVAGLLPSWQFDFFGISPSDAECHAHNMRFLGRIPHGEVSRALSSYEVGLMPFKHFCNETIMDAMERPLKFYEYLAADLGIASTNVGGLKRGMGEWARYGDTPEDFARCIVESAQHARERCDEKLRRFLSNCSWEAVIRQMLDRLACREAL